MKHKAIFFDRDGTLTYFTAEKRLGVTSKSAVGAASHLSWITIK